MISQEQWDDSCKGEKVDASDIYFTLEEDIAGGLTTATETESLHDDEGINNGILLRMASGQTFSVTVTEIL